MGAISGPYSFFAGTPILTLRSCNSIQRETGRSCEKKMSVMEMVVLDQYVLYIFWYDLVLLKEVCGLVGLIVF